MCGNQAALVRYSSLITSPCLHTASCYSNLDPSYSSQPSWACPMCWRHGRCGANRAPTHRALPSAKNARREVSTSVAHNSVTRSQLASIYMMREPHKTGLGHKRILNVGNILVPVEQTWTLFFPVSTWSIKWFPPVLQMANFKCAGSDFLKCFFALGGSPSLKSDSHKHCRCPLPLPTSLYINPQKTNYFWRTANTRWLVWAERRFRRNQSLSSKY